MRANRSENEDIMFGKRKNAIAYGIIGLGRFGEALATELARSGAELLVMDRDEERVREMRELTENALVVNTLDKKNPDRNRYPELRYCGRLHRRAYGILYPDDIKSRQPRYSDRHCQSHQPGAWRDFKTPRCTGRLSRTRYGNSPGNQAFQLPVLDFIQLSEKN